MFTVPELGYSFDALEPHIDAETMEIHHDKHHATYVAKLNEALEGHADLADKSIEDLLTSLDTLPEDLKTPVTNNGGGHFNHSLFWESMKPGGAKEPTGPLLEAINSSLGSFDDLKKQMTEAGLKVFGSGWVWLVKNGDMLEVALTGKQDNPISQDKTPLLGLDVWEHAYYLKYHNRRPDYIAAWWNVVNWDNVANRLK